MKKAFSFDLSSRELSRKCSWRIFKRWNRPQGFKVCPDPDPKQRSFAQTSARLRTHLKAVGVDECRRNSLDSADWRSSAADDGWETDEAEGDAAPRAAGGAAPGVGAAGAGEPPPPCGVACPPLGDVCWDRPPPPPLLLLTRALARGPPAVAACNTRKADLLSHRVMPKFQLKPLKQLRT